MFASNTSAANGAANYIEDVFSTYLYTGNGSTQTITNGIDLAGKGGLVWTKSRSLDVNHSLYDTARGIYNHIATNSTAAQVYDTTGLSAFGATGYTVLSDSKLNSSGNTYASWTFRKQPKFFDVVTYTGNGAARSIAHNLGSVPGCIIIKVTSVSNSWFVYHRSLNDNSGDPYFLTLNSANAQDTGGGIFSTQTSTTFGIRSASDVNQSGQTYVAYLFAHNAGGFGLSGTDNVISCGSFTTDGSGNATVNLGYEPQLNIIKSTGASDWYITDTMRGAAVGSNTSNTLSANSSAAEVTGRTTMKPNATGFSVELNASTTYIYIAIRRGPMQVPTDGTKVFSPNAYVGANGAAQNITAGFPVDMDIIKIRNAGTRDPLNHSRLMGGVFLKTDATSAEASFSDNIVSFNNAQNVIGLPVTGGGTNEINGASTSTYIGWSFRRAPGFFDTVCYTGTGGGANAYLDVSHNLGVTPEMIIVKRRNSADTAPYSWPVYNQAYTSAGVGAAWMASNIAKTTDYVWRRGASGQKVDASTFSLNGNYSMSNASGQTYVAYLFASCPGVSKVGSYTGTGTTQQINCGFTGGARFVLIKRTDSTGDWYVWDSARGIGVGALIGSYYANGSTADYGLGTGEYRIYYNTSLALWYYNAGTYSGSATTQANLEALILSQTGWYVKTGTLMASGTVNFYRLDRYTSLPANDDPYLLLNSTAAEVTNTDYIDTAAAGFEISSTAPDAINANGGSFIFLAIA